MSGSRGNSNAHAARATKPHPVIHTEAGAAKLDELFYGVGAWTLEKDIRLTEPDRFWRVLKPYLKRECGLAYLPEAEDEAVEEIKRTFASANRFNNGGPATDVRLRDLLCKIIGLGTPACAVPKSLLQNQVLVKPSVGKARRCTRNIPKEGFAFGVPVVKNDGGTSGAMNWQVDSTKATGKRESTKKDYARLNRQLVHGGIVSAAEANRYIRTHDVRCRLPSVRSKTEKRENPAKGFGKGNRPSTPIEKVVRNEFELEWLVQGATSPNKPSSPGHRRRQGGRGPGETTASRLRSEMTRQLTEQSGQASGQSKPLFKMKKFASVGPRVSSHRHAQLPQHHSSEAEANHLALEEEQGWANTSGTDYGSP